METYSVVAAVFVALYAAHMVGDHFVQTHSQACGKGANTSVGAKLCAQHVASLTGTKLVFILALWVPTGIPIDPVSLVIGIVIDAGSHYMIDRRFRFSAFCESIGKGEFYRLGSPREGHDDNVTLGTGAYALDQSAHIGFLFLAALIAGT